MTELEERLASIKLMGLPAGVKIVGDEVVLWDVPDDTVELVVPNIVTVVGDNCCSLCDRIRKIKLNEGIIRIGEDAFLGCDYLETIHIPKSVVEIGKDAFGECANLVMITVDDENSHYSSVNGVLFNKDKTVLIRSPKCEHSTYVVPENVTSLYHGAFDGCEAMRGIKIPDTVTEVGSYCLSLCESLVFCRIPVHVKHLREGTFYCCSNLSEVILPDGLESIGASAFDSCYKLEYLIIPDSVKHIESVAFNKCANIVILCYKNSYAEKFAVAHKINYRSV